MPDSMRFSGRPAANSYITAGDRLYVIGAQDGRFPAIGDHVGGEMGGIWAHPIKLADGFALRINGVWLPPAHRITVGPYWTEFEYAVSESFSVVQRQFVPDSEPAMVVSYRFVRNPRDVERPAAAGPSIANRHYGTERVEGRGLGTGPDEAGDLEVAFSLVCDLRPVWLSELDGVTPGEVCAEYDGHLGAWHCRDTVRDWHVFAGAVDRSPNRWSLNSAVSSPELSHGHGVVVDLEYTLDLQGDASITFAVVGGAGTAGDLTDVFRRVAARTHAVDRAKESRYASMIQRSQLSVPDRSIQTAWDWLKCNNDWLVRDVPGVGRGIGAGAPEYVWWFGCDTAYAVPSLLALGQAVVALDTLDLLRTLSCAAGEGSGRVIHEATTSGRVANPGCTEETALFTSAVYEVVRWTGDRAFLDRNYDFCRRGLLDWVLGAMDPERNRMPLGYGIVEIEGLDLRCLDVIAYTIAALNALGGMATIVGDTKTVTQCAGLEPILRSRLESDFWVEPAGMYADVVGSSHEMLPRLRRWRERYDRSDTAEFLSFLDRYIQTADSAPEPDRLRPWILGNWIAACPVDSQLPSIERAASVLDRLECLDYSRRWGMAVNGFDPESVVMSLPTGVLASAEAAYGRWDQALRYMRTVLETLPLGMPGAISEISPDAGCYVQAWSAYAVTQPLVRHMFGFRPDAIRRHIDVAPSFPPGWDEASLRTIPIGETTCDLIWERGKLAVTVAEAGWDVTVNAAREPGRSYGGG